MELVGCTIDELKQHLESKFKKGMSWNNYGKWHVDHVVPVDFFDLTKIEEQKKIPVLPNKTLGAEPILKPRVLFCKTGKFTEIAE